MKSGHRERVAFLMGVKYITFTLQLRRGTRWRSWLRHCATSRNVAGLIPDGFIGIFHWHNPSSRTMLLGLTHPLTEMCTRNVSWEDKGGRCVGLTILPLSCWAIWNLGALTSWNPQGLSRPVIRLLYFVMNWTICSFAFPFCRYCLFGVSCFVIIFNVCCSYWNLIFIVLIFIAYLLF